MEKRVNTENIYKLNTKEDSLYLHKILGVIVLINFVYRYIYFYSNGHMNFKNNWDLYILFLHGLLSVSSLVFHIPKLRNPLQPMIYPEYRLHSIVFALRSVICCIVYYFYISNNYNYKFIIVVCGSTMVAADIITLWFNPSGKNGSTMRNMPFDKSISIEDQNKITFMHSYSQIGATLFMFGNIETAFSPLFAIQIAAVLMTMVRKGIIDAYMWHLMYSLCLWINYIFFTSITPGCFVLFQTVFNLHYYIVFPYRINKYLAWLSHFTFIILYKEFGYENLINGVVLDNYNKEWYWFIRGFIITIYCILFYRYRVLYNKLLLKNKKT